MTWDKSKIITNQCVLAKSCWMKLQLFWVSDLIKILIQSSFFVLKLQIYNWFQQKKKKCHWNQLSLIILIVILLVAKKKFKLLQKRPHFKWELKFIGLREVSFFPILFIHSCCNPKPILLYKDRKENMFLCTTLVMQLKLICV